MRSVFVASLASVILGIIALFALDQQNVISILRPEPLLQSKRRNLQTQKALVLKGNDGRPESAFPLGECEGECDIDADCAQDLVCFHRNQGDPVPGCRGTPVGNWDYCVKPDPYPNNRSESIPVLPPLQQLQYVGNNGVPNTPFPLAKCQGDCDTDDECAGTMVCFQRNGNETVPGCSGNDPTGNDYCYDPNDSLESIPGTNVTSNQSIPETFGLKLHWEEGYLWQEETIERKWCLRCESDQAACWPGRRVYLTNCETDMITQFQFVYQEDASFFIKLANTDLCLTAPDDTRDRYLVQYCDTRNARQMFVTSGNATWGGTFEIHPEWARDGCVSNTHHPKFGESLYLWSCSLSRFSDTSLWTFY